jgi:hypothetical protein
MFSKNDFLEKYRQCSDAELMKMYQGRSSYSAEAQDAMLEVIHEKGGIEKLTERLESQEIIVAEIKRLKTEIHQLNNKYTDLEFMKKMVHSGILTPEQLDQLIEAAYQEAEEERDDQAIKPRTVNGSIFGGAFAAITGGVLWGLMLMYSEKQFIFFIAGLALYCFFWIRIATKQSIKNQVVIIATIISTLLALGIGAGIYKFYGYRGPERNSMSGQVIEGSRLPDSVILD